MTIITFATGCIAFGLTLATAALLTCYSFQLAAVPLQAVIHATVCALDAWLVFALLLGMSALIRPTRRKEPDLHPLEQPSRLYRAR